jgi:hypothetical protein
MVRSKRAAIEMSIGTIVTLVLSITLLIILISVITKIGDLSHGVLDQTESQITDQINKAFGEDKTLGLTPSDGELNIKQGKSNGFAFNVKNELSGTEGVGAIFSYVVVVASDGNCDKTDDELMNLIIYGESESGLSISPGGTLDESRKVKLVIPKDFPTCSFGYRVDVSGPDGSIYAQAPMIINVG